MQKKTIVVRNAENGEKSDEESEEPEEYLVAREKLTKMNATIQ